MRILEYIMSAAMTSVGLGLMITYGLYRRFSKGTLLPKYFKEKEEDSFVDLAPGPANQNPYHSDKIPRDLDAIVIGSGLAGLTTAGLLAKTGWKVLVVDSAMMAGGFHKPDDSLLIKPELGFTMTKDVLDLIMEQPVRWGTATVPSGDISNRYNELSADFPTEIDEVHKYLREVQRTAKLKDLFFFLKVLQPKSLRRWLINRMFSEETEGWLADKPFSQASQRSVRYQLANRGIKISSQLENALNHKFLREHFRASQLDLGKPDASFWLHSLAINQYLGDHEYPMVENYDELINPIIPTIEKAGGRVLVWNGVKEVILETEAPKSIWNLWGLLTNSKPKAVGVIMENDENEIRAPVIISDLNLTSTFTKLIPESVSRQWCGWDLISNCGLHNSYAHPDRFNPQVSQYLEPETGVKGFYLTGKEVTIPGVHGSVISGLLTASTILGYGTILDAFRGRSLVKDLSNLTNDKHN